MKRTLAVLLPLALAACADGPSVPTAVEGPAASSAPVAGDYVVVLKEGANPRSVAAVLGIDPRFVYTAALNGFAGTLSAGQLTALRNNPAVDYVEPDAPARLFTTQSSPYSWGLDRVDQRSLPLSNAFTYTATGAGVNVYIIDTGIRLSHLDFGGRAQYVPNGANGDFRGDGQGNGGDCHGHGTHVAGTAAGTYSGVAKAATIWAARVLDCAGAGNVSMAIAAVDWITANGLRPAVVNMSLGYGNVQSMRDAVERSVAAGVVYAVAAGNGNFVGRPLDACTEAPAGAPNALTVGSTTSSDAESSFSNYGTCVDILAPGSTIMSSDFAGDDMLVTKSGTSMASPHVAGVAAQYLSLNPTATPAQVMSAVKSGATPNAISLHRSSQRYGTPNLMLFTGY
ncbi:MAG TPA: S8 family peptidase [Longimicrobiaceae bacterium]|nr:S8 family peptidase [Longimicrobiaceae bacterium]